MSISEYPPAAEAADQFGITMALPGLAFQVDVSRAVIPQMVRNIDMQIDDGQDADAPLDLAGRIQSAMSYVSATARASHSGEIDYETAAAEMGFAMLYVWIKHFGMDQLAGVSGLIGAVSDDMLVFNPCLSSGEYREATAHMRDALNGDVVDLAQLIPTRTLH